MFDKGVNLGVLHDYVLERVAHFTFPPAVSICRGRESCHRCQFYFIPDLARKAAEFIIYKKFQRSFSWVYCRTPQWFHASERS
jgi:hypothetical protein